MESLLTKIAKIVTDKYPDSSIGARTLGKESIGDELYRDRVDYKEKVAKSYKKTKKGGKFEDLVVNTLDSSPQSGAISPNTHQKEHPARNITV